MLPENIRLKATRVVTAIQAGTVAETDVELLLIWLREAAQAVSPFREIAHFVAHPKRDCGQTFEALYKLYCRWRAYSVYQHKKQHLNLDAPLGRWFVDFLHYQVDEIGSQALQTKIGLSRKAAHRLINNAFRETKGAYACTQPASRELVALITEAFSFIRVAALYEQAHIVNSFNDTLLAAGLIAEHEQLEAQSNKVLLCLLTLMSKRTFHIGKDVIGTTVLTAPVDGFGKLQPLELRGQLTIPDFPRILFTLVATDLTAADWVHAELLVQRETNLKGHYWTVFDEDAHVQAKEKDGRFVLSRYEQA